MAEDTKAPVRHQLNRPWRFPSLLSAFPFAWAFVRACAAPAAEPVILRDQRNVEMVRVPAISFVMGDDASGADEKPSHRVAISAFLIDRTEVTYAQYRAFLLENPEWRKGRVRPSLADANYLLDWNGLDYPSGLDNYPVVWVSWAAAAAYAKWRGARLPTEAEWEAAARGNEGRQYPWGESNPDGDAIPRCNYRSVPPDRDGYLKTAPVGSYPHGASPFTIFDMAGNVWEWVADWHDPDFYAESPEFNPSGPESGTYRVLRGGSWSVPSSWVRSTVRLRAYPVRSSDQVGFRCARSLPGQGGATSRTN